MLHLKNKINVLLLVCKEGGPHCVVVNMLDCDFAVSVQTPVALLYSLSD